MVNLSSKRWYFFLWDEHNIDHLEEHKITPDEAEELFFNRYVITPNKKKHGPGRFRIDGRTNRGRYLRLIFEDLGQHTARVITGWDI
jgi:uncharacterized DUF497 family protein